MKAPYRGFAFYAADLAFPAIGGSQAASLPQGASN
jgi:hypothetical protein